MSESLEVLIDKIVSVVSRAWELLIGEPGYGLQEVKERTPDIRRALVFNQLRRSFPPSDHGCDRY